MALGDGTDKLPIKSDLRKKSVRMLRYSNDIFNKKDVGQILFFTS
jgi:hypothetical protein